MILVAQRTIKGHCGLVVMLLVRSLVQSQKKKSNNSKEQDFFVSTSVQQTPIRRGPSLQN